MAKYGHCASCYFFTRYYCSKHDMDVDKMNGCNEHKTLEEVRAEKENYDNDEEV